MHIYVHVMSVCLCINLYALSACVSVFVCSGICVCVGGGEVGVGEGVFARVYLGVFVRACMCVRARVRVPVCM